MNLCSENGVSPQCKAYQQEHESVVELLLNERAKTNLLNLKRKSTSSRKPCKKEINFLRNILCVHLYSYKFKDKNALI